MKSGKLKDLPFFCRRTPFSYKFMIFFRFEWILLIMYSLIDSDVRSLDLSLGFSNLYLYLLLGILAVLHVCGWWEESIVADNFITHSSIIISTHILAKLYKSKAFIIKLDNLSLKIFGRPNLYAFRRLDSHSLTSLLALVLRQFYK